MFDIRRRAVAGLYHQQLRVVVCESTCVQGFYVGARGDHTEPGRLENSSESLSQESTPSSKDGSNGATRHDYTPVYSPPVFVSDRLPSCPNRLASPNDRVGCPTQNSGDICVRDRPLNCRWS